MSRGRLEAFSDGVLAVVITIMVLELRPPDGNALSDLRPLVPKLCVYLLSFTFIAIYWNNHHNLMHAVQRVSGGVLWANAHLLFWLSLTPVAAAWLGPNLADSAPVAVYGVVLLGSALAYWILTQCLLRSHDADSVLARGVGRDRKGKLSIVAYVVAVALAYVAPWVSIALYVAVAAAWLVPDRRLERLILPAANEPEQLSRATTDRTTG